MSIYAYPRAPTHETARQVTARTELNDWIVTFRAAYEHRARRIAARQIRALARDHAWLADQIPDDVWAAVYNVRTAAGTVTP